MTEKKKFRVFATSRIGDPAENRLRKQGYELEVFQGPEAPPKKLIIEKVKSGIDALITTLRDPIDAEVFEPGKGSLKVVAQIAVGFDNINRADANKYKIPFANTADVLTEATAEFAFLMLGMSATVPYIELGKKIRTSSAKLQQIAAKMMPEQAQRVASISAKSAPYLQN